MNQNYITVSSSAIENDRSRLDHSIINVSNRLQSVIDKANVLSQNWQGDANAAFIRTMQEDIEFMGELLSEIANFSNALINAEKEYVNCEYDVQSRIQYLGV